MQTCNGCGRDLVGGMCPACRVLAEGDSPNAAAGTNADIPSSPAQPAPSSDSLPDPFVPAPERASRSLVAGMGPGKSGKTATALGITQAAHLPVDDGVRFHAVAGEALAELLGRGIGSLMYDSIRLESTTSAQEWTLTVDAEDARCGFLRRPRRVSTVIAFSDGPGGGMFAREADRGEGSTVERWQAELVAKARDAEAHILCIDANGVDADLVAAQLPALLARMALPTRTSRLARGGRMRPALRAPRYLVLLTKVDVLADRVLGDLRDGRIPDVPATFAGRRLDSLRPIDIADAMDPVQLAVDMLGTVFLSWLQAVLPSGGQLAVGLSSAWGFVPSSGEPLCFADGRPNRPSAENAFRLQRLWTPYGLRDALRFLMFGDAVGACMKVDPRDLVARAA